MRTREPAHGTAGLWGMMFGLFRRSANEAVVERLYTIVVEASREPALYADLGVPDTFEGRFESLSLHTILVLRRLQGAEAPGPAIAQDLVDLLFRHFDRTFREMGVGDTTVPKRMKTMAEAFAGRSAAYDAALKADRPALVGALARNIYAGVGDAGPLARHVEAVQAAIAAAPVQAFVDGTLVLPRAASVPSSHEVSP